MRRGFAIVIACSSALACGADGVEAERRTVDPVVLAAGASTDALPTCPVFGPLRATGTLENPAIIEASGIVASRRQEDVLWLHNDSGDRPRLYAVSPAGATLAAFELAGARARDWEDLALGPGPEPGRDYLYIGDIGDNVELRRKVTVYRVLEPQLSKPPGTMTTLDGAVALDFRYPDGPHDAEALLSDPATGDLVIVTKLGERGPQAFRAPAPHDGGSIATLEPIASLSLSADDVRHTMITGGDITAAGDLVAVRSYGNALVWRRLGAEPLARTLARPACPLEVGPDDGGEAFGFLPDGAGYVVVSEGAGATLWRSQ